MEILDVLIEWAGGYQPFAKATGIRVPDQKHYLNRNKNIRMKRLKRAAQQVFGTPPAFRAIHERQELPAKLPQTLHGVSGLYAFFSSSGSLIYFGQAKDLFAEINQTLRRLTPSILFLGRKRSRHTYRAVTKFYSAYEVTRGDDTFIHDVEALVLHAVLNDTFNANLGWFKR